MWQKNSQNSVIFIFFKREKVWQKFDFSHFGEILHPKEALG